MRESRNFEFKTGGGAYPIQILPEVRHSGDSVLCFTIFLKSKVAWSVMHNAWYGVIFLQHIRKYGSAFLNCDGGVLIAGILDNGNY